MRVELASYSDCQLSFPLEVPPAELQPSTRGGWPGAAMPPATRPGRARVDGGRGDRDRWAEGRAQPGSHASAHAGNQAPGLSRLQGSDGTSAGVPRREERGADVLKPGARAQWLLQRDRSMMTISQVSR